MSKEVGVNANTVKGLDEMLDKVSGILDLDVFL